MGLNVPRIDGRTQDALGGRLIQVTDSDTGKVVGRLDIAPMPTDPSRYRTISLFDGKYVESFATHEECVAFAKGVDAVLKHMVSTGNERSPKQKPDAA